MAASSESEYVALAEVANELRFLCQVTEFMALAIENDIKISGDSKGTIKMVTNRLSTTFSATR